ncbi:MAG: ParB/RepB/Spo0J family partition protein [Planctomycetes bacterium]|nr:ParB/RepB/Spo0J family partition protein [Planctomycetota bacterium]
MERRLGRGLGSLLGTPTTEETPAAPTTALPIDKIRPNAEQPRRVFDPAGLEELRDSILQHGVLQPVVVRSIEGGYELIAGERRWRCARLAGLAEIPAIVREVGDQERLELALVENVQRRDLDAMEKARGYKRMQDGLGLTQEQVAKKVGLKRATVANHLRLLELPGEVQQAVSEGLITMGHARALLALPTAEEQKAALGRIVREGLSVRGIEDLARAQATPTRAAVTPTETADVEQEATEPTKELVPEAPWIRDLQRRMQVHLGTKVSLASREGYKGKIVIEYYNREDLERLIALLAPQESL